MTYTKLRKTLMALLALCVISAPFAGAVAAQNSALNYNAGPNPYIEEDRLDVAAYNLSEMSGLQYYDDSGEVTSLPATMNSSIDDPYKVRFDKIEEEEFGLFPRVNADEKQNNTASALDASEWTTSGGMTVSDSDGSTADGVESIQIATNGTMAATDVASASYSNFTIDTDAEKRVAFAVFNVDTLDSGATATIEFSESDGDTKVVTIASSANASDVDVAANASGNGYVYQEKLADISTTGTGDGTFSSIDSVDVEVTDADATLTVVALDADRKSKLTLGETTENEDSENEKTVAIENVTTSGEVELKSLSSLGETFDDAVIHDLGIMGVQYQAEDLMSGDVQVEFSDAPNYGSYPSKVDVFYRLNVPSAIDLSHSGLTLKAEQKFVGARYATLRLAEDTTKEFGNISSSSWTDISGSFSGVDETHDLDTSVQADTNYVLNYEILLQDDEVRTLQDTSDGGAGGPVGSSGGILGSIYTWIGGAIATVLGWFKLRSN